MFGTIASVLIMLIAAIISYLSFRSAAGAVRNIGKASLLELDWILEKTPAQASYFMFMLQSFIIVSAAAFAFRVSKHIILTLDILYLITNLMLILHHTLKIAPSLSIRKI